MKVKRLLMAFLVLAAAILACANPISDSSDGDTTDPSSSLDAKGAIQTFAGDVLGLELDALLAGGTSGQVNLPISTQEGVDLAIDLAGTTYFGIWKQGVASLSYGDGAVSGDWVADVKDGALGAFVVRSEQPLPGDASTALQMILETFPALNAYSFDETPSNAGFSFLARDADNIGVMSWSLTLTGSTIKVGMAPQIGGGQSMIWAMVASGALAAPFGQ